MDPIVASIVGGWVVENDEPLRKRMDEYDYAIRRCRDVLIYSSTDHALAVRRMSRYERIIENTRGALLGSFLNTCQAAAEHSRK